MESKLYFQHSYLSSAADLQEESTGDNVPFQFFTTIIVISPLSSLFGPSIKYITLDGEGVRESVTVCDVTLFKFLCHTYET